MNFSSWRKGTTIILCAFLQSVSIDAVGDSSSSNVEFKVQEGSESLTNSYSASCFQFSGMADIRRFPSLSSDIVKSPFLVFIVLKIVFTIVNAFFNTGQKTRVMM